MPSEKMSATEAWVRLEAPELLTGPLAKDVDQFIKDDDLNGLAHFLQRQSERYQSAVSEAADITDAEREDAKPETSGFKSQEKKQTARHDTQGMNERDKDLHIAQQKVELKVLEERMQKKDQTIEELQAQIRTLKNEPEQ